MATRLTALSGRCPHISVLGHEAVPFPAAPPQTGREVLPHPAFHRTVGPLLSVAGSSWPSGRSPFSGADQPSGHYSGGPVRSARSGCQAFPPRKLCCLPAPAVLCPAPTPSRLVHTRTEEGLSSSVSGSPCIPRPLTPEGSWRLRFPGLHRFHGLRRLAPGSAPPCPLLPEGA